MRGLLGALTVRGRSFVAAGLAAIACGVLIPEPDLVRIGLLLQLPFALLAYAAARLLLRAGRVVGRLLADRAVPPAPAGLVPAARPAELVLPRSPALSLGWGVRGPPLPA